MSKTKTTPTRRITKTEQAQQLRLFQDVSRLISADETTENILLFVLNQLLETFEYSAAQVYQLSTSKKDLWLYLEMGQSNQPVTQNLGIFSIDENNAISDSARTGQVVYVPEVNQGPYSYYSHNEIEAATGSDLAIPLKFKQVYLGVLYLQSNTPAAFSKNDIEFLTNLSDLLASTMNNKRTIDQLQDSIQEIKTLYTLQFQDNLQQQQQRRAEQGKPVGYQYNKSTVAKIENPPETIPGTGAAITSNQKNGSRELLAPIQLHGETIGVLGLENVFEPGADWTTDDISLLEEVSSQVALAIENSQLLQQTQERTNELSVLFEATRQLTETIELKEIYQILTTQIINYLQADCCSVLLLNKERTHFEVSVAEMRTGNGQIELLAESRAEVVADYPSLQRMLKRPEVIIHHLDDRNLDPNTHKYMQGKGKPGRKIYTLTRFPLIVRSKLIAIMEVEHLQQPRAYTENELQLAQAIISQVTVAIENGQLFQQTQSALSETQTLYEISRQLVESATLDDVFRLVLENVKAFGVDRVSISLLDRSHLGEIETVTIVATWDKDLDRSLPVVGTRFSAHDFALVKTFAIPPLHPLISHDLRTPTGQDERLDEAFRQYVASTLDAVTMFSVPMFLGAEYKGVLSIYTRDPHIYTEQETRVYQTLADQSIIAIENYRLLDATRRERDRASLLYDLGQKLSHTTTVEQVQNTVVGFFQQVGATDGEIYITDGGDFVSRASTFAVRQNLPLTRLSELAFAEGLEAQALTQQESIVQLQADTPEDEWPLKDLAGMSDVKALACIPFYSQRSTLQGVLSFFHTDPEGFLDDQTTTFDSIAIQTSASLENVWLLRQTNVVLSETELLYNVTRGFNSAKSVEDLLAVISGNLTDIGVDFMSIALISGLDNNNKPQSLNAIAGRHKQIGDVPDFSLGPLAQDYNFLQQMRINAPVEIYYNKQEPTVQAGIDEHLHKARTILAIPLVAGDNWLGVLLLTNQTDDFVFKLNTINQISTLAGQASVIIQNLQLVEKTEQNLRDSKVLSSLGQELLSTESTEAIYNLALKAIAATEPDRGVAIFIYDQIEGGIELELVGIWDHPRQEWPFISQGSRLSTEDLGLVPLLKTGLTITSSNATQDERFSPTLRQLLMMMQINVLVAVPIWLNKEVGGFMLIGNQTFTPFSPDVIRLYEDVAVETSGGLDNRRLLDEVQYRAWQLQIAAEVSQTATAHRELGSLLSESVELIKDRFNFYHTSIFLVDSYRRYAEVKASTGEIGQKMLEMKHRLEVGGRSIVGTATGTGQSCIALDVGHNAVHFNNPLLPQTRSEMALPLISQGQVIGALDVQSSKRAAFSDSDITILQSMANQLANAIDAARSFQESKEALDEVSKLHQRYLSNQWESFIEQKPNIRYQLTEDGTIVESEDAYARLTEMDKAVEAKQPMIVPAFAIPETDNTEPATNGKNAAALSHPNTTGKSTLVAPITLNGQAVIGTVDFEIAQEDPSNPWNDDILKIVEAVTSQAAQAIEASRLFEQTTVAREEAEALYQVGRSLVAIETETDMFYTVLGKMLSTLGLKQGGALLFNDDKQRGKLYALYQENKPVYDSNIEFPIAENMSYQKMIETKQPVAIADMATDPLVEKVREMGLVGNIASLLLVPIIINDEVIGALGADAVGKKHRFTDREMNLAMAMADQLSIALQNRRLIEETRRRAILLQISAEVSGVATSILDEDQLMDKTVELIKDRFGFYHVQIFLTDEAGQYAVLHKSTGQLGEKLLAAEHKLAIGGQSVIGQVTYQRKSVVARNAEMSDIEISRHRNEFLPDTQAELAVPLQVGNTLIGALDVQSTQVNAFTDEEISTLETLTAQLAVAIQNARAFREQLETAERLKEIDKLKTQFLANMSHELRTPLNSIIGFSRVILKGIDGPLTELQKADLTSIHNSGQHLLGLINNILDLSKIEAGKMELNIEESEIEPIIKTVMATAIALVKDKEVRLIQDVPENLPTIWADSTRIRQIVLNLVSNACKFTETGAVTARVRADDERVTFSVSDTGMGIPADQIQHIFEEFTQVDASTTRKVGGTGLGLPISRHFVEMHKGKIWVESRPGQGTTFSFYIPIKPHAEKKEPDLAEFTILPKNLDDTKLTVVAIDDDPTVITLYQRFLENQNYEVIGLNHGKDAVSKVKDYAPFAILLDVMIPDKDGWSIIQELKKDPATKNIPVVICSIVSDKNKGFSLGAANYLIKPIVESELVSALEQLDAHKKDGVRVLVVDDQADDILLIRRILEAQANYTIFEASNGKEGLDLVKNKEPDLLILDLNMPEMDGFAMIEALKSNEITRSIPIIIVSAQELSHEEHERLTGQVEVLLRKGIFTENELLEDISQALHRIRREEKVSS